MAKNNNNKETIKYDQKNNNNKETIKYDQKITIKKKQ